MNNPYERPTPVDIKVPAEMLEIVAGFPDEARIDRELTFGMGAVDLRDPATLHWVAALIETKLTYIQED